jgi:CRP-like cAMP-binding protein
LLDDAGRQRLVSASAVVIFPERTVIVREGESGDSFFLIVSGAVEVDAAGFAGTKHLATLGPGAIFGEIAALTREPRTATVTTVGQTEVLRFDAHRVVEILKSYPKVIEMLNRIGLRRSEQALERILDDDAPADGSN